MKNVHWGSVQVTATLKTCTNSVFSWKTWAQRGMPDFYSLNVGVPVYGYINWNINIAMDRHFQWYVSPLGIGLGYPSGRFISLTASWLQQPKKPNPSEMYNFLSGHAIGVSLGYYTGGVYNVSPTNSGTQSAWGFGIMTPQFGGSYNYTPDILIFNRK